MKICPYCFSKLPGNVKKCRHCGEWIVGPDSIPSNKKKDNDKKFINGKRDNILYKKLFILFGIVVSVIIFISLFLLKNRLGFSIFGSRYDNVDENGLNNNGIVQSNRYQKIPSIDISDWKKYDDGMISFKYPSNLIVSNEEFDTFGFNQPSNIHVQVYTFSQIFDDIIDNDLYWALAENKDLDTIKYSKERTQHYKGILQNIKDGKGVKSASSKDFFDHFSSRRTAGAITAFPVTINGINGLVVNYYFTQDPNAGCLSQFNTELLVVKDENTIISIMFKNNFGGVKDLLSKYNGTSTICIGDNGDYKIAEDASNYIRKYYENGESLEGTKYRVFEENDELITRIIHTFKLLK